MKFEVTYCGFPVHFLIFQSGQLGKTSKLSGVKSGGHYENASLVKKLFCFILLEKKIEHFPIVILFIGNIQPGWPSSASS